MKLRKQRKNGFSITSVVIGSVLVAIVTPVIGKMMISQAVVQAKVMNLQQADLKATQWALASKEADRPLDEEGEVPDGCTVTTDAEEGVEPDLQTNVWTIECWHGTNPRTRQRAAVNVSFFEQDYYGLGDTDDDRDGYLDKSGLPTHYQQCYNGFKGPEGAGKSGDFSNSCNIGEEPYVIPLYADLYDDEA